MFSQTTIYDIQLQKLPSFSIKCRFKSFNYLAPVRSIETVNYVLKRKKTF